MRFVLYITIFSYTHLYLFFVALFGWPFGLLFGMLILYGAIEVFLIIVTMFLVRWRYKITLIKSFIIILITTAVSMFIVNIINPLKYL
jgi:hypothetical protein